MAWVESHQEVGQHPKTLKAAKKLGVSVPTMVGHLHLLWHWAVAYADTGELDRWDDDDLALGAMWDGDSQEFVRVLTDVGFIDVTESGRQLHDWMDYAGRLVRERERKRAVRAGQSDGGTTTTTPASADSPQTGGGQEGDGPRAGTEPNQPNQPNQPGSGSDEPEVSDTARELVRRFAAGVQANGHSVPERRTKANSAWLSEMELLLERGPPGEGGHVPDADEVRQVVDWCVADHGDDRYPGEATNVRSVPKFRKRYSELRRKALRPTNGQIPLRGGPVDEHGVGKAVM